MKLYTYDKSGFFSNEINAPICQITGEPMLVINSTEIAPPSVKENQLARCSGEGWEIVTDLRGTEYWLDDKLHTITEIGLELPEGASLNKPQSVISAEFEQHKQAARVEINRMRDTRICAGVEFPPDSGVMFDSDELAQKNINGAVTMSLLAVAAGQPFEQPWIAKNNAVVTLDAAGVAGLGVTLGKHVGRHRLEANVYKTQLDAATDAVAVQAIIDEYKVLS